ncbi:MAG: hypothetical protein COA94_04845 [Rickettsiales bacterium]|nr:MAG: hypothetical protein COA94_04845 [Rickettsiales bacterium]
MRLVRKGTDKTVTQNTKLVIHEKMYQVFAIIIPNEEYPKGMIKVNLNTGGEIHSWQQFYPNFLGLEFIE